MPSPKRARKRAGRQARLAQVEAARKRKSRLRRGIILAVIAVVVIGLVALLGRGGSKSPAKTQAAKPRSARSGPTTSTTAVAPAGATLSGPTPCPAADGSSPRTVAFAQPPPMCVNPATAYTATFTTDVGTYAVALDAKAAPKTVNDFIVLARYHFYDGLTFHRVIPGFVVQGGDPKGNGSGGPGYTVAGEVPPAGAYKIGSLAMAKTSADPPGSAGSQFFIITGQQGTQLPPQYSLFGMVNSGTDVVAKIDADGTPSGTPKVVHHILKVVISPSS